MLLGEERRLPLSEDKHKMKVMTTYHAVSSIGRAEHLDN